MKRFLLLFVLILTSCKSLEQKTASQVILASDVAARSADAPVEATGKRFAISTQGKHASLAAKEIFDHGGNIIDAFVAASFVISVERPHSTGIGGGGFLVFHDATSGKNYAVDFRERAPMKASEKMFQDKQGQVVTRRSLDGVLAAAVPGLVAGLYEIHQKFGHLPWKDVLAPAIRVAEEGFVVYRSFHSAMQSRAPILRDDPEARKIFLDAKGEPWPIGSLFKQPELAKTLRLIAEKGRDGFYHGRVAQQLESLMQKQHGLITAEDLARYRVRWREPLQGSFDGYQVYSMPPPSSGGVHVLQFLNTLEDDHLSKDGFLSVPAIHLAAGALQLAFADRARYLGDPDFVKVPVAELISKSYAKQRRALIPADRALKANEVHAGDIPGFSTSENSSKESNETTHMSLIDSDGNAVASTQTINGWLGAAVVVPGTGVLLNNEMDDFSAKTGASNMFGAIGGPANSVAPGKAPLSAMSPTILLKDGKVVLSVGAPGGTRIISCVAQTILNWAEFKLPLRESVAAVRYHHQWQPDVLTIDPPGPATATLKKLTEMGYNVDIGDVPCNVMAAERVGDQLHAVADPRDVGTSAAE